MNRFNVAMAAFQNLLLLFPILTPTVELHEDPTSDIQVIKKTMLFFGNIKKENTFAVPIIVLTCRVYKLLISFG